MVRRCPRLVYPDEAAAVVLAAAAAKFDQDKSAQLFERTRESWLATWSAVPPVREVSGQ